MDCSPPGSSVHGILQVRILEWVAMPSSRDQTRISYVSCIDRWDFYHQRHLRSPQTHSLHWKRSLPTMEVLPSAPTPFFKCLFLCSGIHLADLTMKDEVSIPRHHDVISKAALWDAAVLGSLRSHQAAVSWVKSVAHMATHHLPTCPLAWVGS